MSLDWNISNCKQLPQSVEGTRMQVRKTEGLIWATIATDMGKITSDNAREFYVRIHLWESLHGAQYKTMKKDGRHERIVDDPITLADVKQHVGLVTNVITLSRTKWLKKINGILDRRAREAEHALDRENAVVQGLIPKYALHAAGRTKRPPVK